MYPQLQLMVVARNHVHEIIGVLNLDKDVPPDDIFLVGQQMVGVGRIFAGTGLLQGFFFF